MALKKPGRRHSNELLRSQLEIERSSFLDSWRACGDYISPFRPRFTLTDRNRGDRKNRNIIDSTATLALRTMVSGLMTGITSPARPWFNLTTQDKDLAEFEPVKQWLYQVTQRMRAMFLRSNLYQALPMLYKDLGSFGTSAMGVEEDFKRTARFYSFPIGSYCLATNHQGKVDTFHREFGMTVRQVVQKFGQVKANGEIDWSNISTHVKSLWEQGNTEAWIDICHMVRPNADYDSMALKSQSKLFSSQYYERGLYSGNKSSYFTDGEDKLLRDRGYDQFPILAARWGLTGEDTYATEWPALDALGDVKQLQLGERRSMQAIDKMVNPPLQAPTALQSKKVSILPGDTTYVDVRESTQGIRPVHEVNFRIQELEMKQEQVRRRIQRIFFEDIFLMMTEIDRSDVTATEIIEKREEKFLVLGPVLDQLNNDVLDPIIDLGFDFMMKQNQIPMPPKELQGQDLKVEYISTMAQAQKLVGIGNVERFMNFAIQLASVNPAAMDKVNFDQGLDVYGEQLSVPPGIVVPDEQVQVVRVNRQKAMEAQQKAMVAKDASIAAKNLSQSDMGSDNALTRLTGQ